MKNRHLACLLFLGSIFAAQAATAGEIQDAAFKGDTKEVRALLDKDPALARAADENGWTPLHAAADAGHTELVKLLVAKGAVIDAKTKVGWTPLMTAACNGRKEAAALLISKGARLDIGDVTFGRNPLHWAAIQGHADVAELLITKGAKVNTRDKANATPLGYAKSYRRAELESLLAKHGGRS